MTIKFTCTGAEDRLITAILDRAQVPAKDRRVKATDLEACHSNGCPLDFQALLLAEKFDFWHDLNGISSHIDRTTGKLLGLFDPRCSKAVVS